jgi:hypothetical protein
LPFIRAQIYLIVNFIYAVELLPAVALAGSVALTVTVGSIPAGSLTVTVIDFGSRFTNSDLPQFGHGTATLLEISSLTCCFVPQFGQ